MAFVGRGKVRISNAYAAVVRWLVYPLIFGGALGYAGCNPPSGDPFHVQATLSTETCGSGAVAPEDEWEFDIRLERDDSVLIWVRRIEWNGIPWSHRG
ncbi:MAG: hypothetical protein QM784_07120 [Polyangiaceae bacterium]